MFRFRDYVEAFIFAMIETFFIVLGAVMILGAIGLIIITVVSIFV